MYYSFSRLSQFDVKWADLFDANTSSFVNVHQNPFYELIVVADGTVHLQTGSDKLTLQAGEALLLMPWEQHRGWKPSERQGQFFWAQFSCTPEIAEFGAEPAAELNIVQAHRSELRTSSSTGPIEDSLVLPRRFQTRHRYKVLSRFEELVDTLERPKGYFRFQATLLLGELLRLLSTDFLEQSETHVTFPASYAVFRKLVNHLNNAYVYEVTKETLERVVDRKYEYLCQVFKKYTGLTIVHYTQQLRIQQAKHLLRNTAATVQSIGESVGFADPFYFSRTFKKLEGMSPQQYRTSGAGNGERPPRE
ncbi:helix-turn-helix domain-containing protein [Paenibacillus sp. HJGM_3]|uniref:AraC family transcriptional regulator n=1 Tax=Paenibacillus sp. HJGM_3 TaxID=3379816 RepID=UPI00385FA903